jgi:hypothetical protein
MDFHRCILPVIKTSAYLPYALSKSCAFAGFRRIATKSDPNAVLFATSLFIPLSDMPAEAVSATNAAL